MLLSAPLSTRNQFPDLLNQRKLLGQIAEIGSHRGEYAAHLRRVWKGETVHCIDPWSKSDADHMLPNRGPNRLADRQACNIALRKVNFGRGHRIWQGTSGQALGNFADLSLDFVYIDGDHRYEPVLFDLLNWWKKIRSGGIIAGHDFVSPGEAGTEGNWGRFVQRAVHDFIATLPEGIETPVQVIVEENGLPWSFYIEKP